MVDRVHGLWTAQGWPVHGSTVDLTVVGSRSSPELSPPIAMVSEKSSRMEKLGESNDAKLTRGFSGRCGKGGRPVAGKQIGGGFFSWT
jgi:hypothetical protein